MVLLHGDCDRSCPVTSTKEFAAILRRMGVPVGEKYYQGKTHTDFILEDPIRGNDILVRDIVELINKEQHLGERRRVGTEVPSGGGAVGLQQDTPEWFGIGGRSSHS